MNWPDAGMLGDAVSAAAFAALAAMLVLRWRERPHAALLASVCAVTALWSCDAAAGAGLDAAAESLRTAAWLALLARLGVQRGRGFWLGLAVAGLSLVSLALRPGVAVFGARLALAVLGMLLIEQVYRNVAPGNRWGIKYFCLGAGVLFAYDFYLYSDALLFQRANADIWAARGIVDALSVPLIAVSAARNPRWERELAVSRRMLLHSATLLGSALYLLTMALSGYYLRLVGGSWGRVMQLAFLCGAAVVLVGVLFSGAARARLKVVISKHFYRGRYDYREEWLRLSRALADDGPAFGERAIIAVASLVESPAGALWLADEDGAYLPAAHWNMPQQEPVAGDDPLCQFVAARHWVYEAGAQTLARAAHQPAPAWFARVPQGWLLVPLMLHGRLYGFVVLAQPRTPVSLNWEVTDLLKVAGSQAASYLAYRASWNALTVARQFESFNRMSAFVVHDLKNMVFQFSLLLTNAERHRHNPDFHADMLGTLADSLAKMKRLLQRLHQAEPGDAPQALDLAALLRRVVAAKALAHGALTLELRDTDLYVSADPERLERVVGHLIQNAMDASVRDAAIRIGLHRDGDEAVVEVEDHGQGMSAQFLATRLFQPFVSTKQAGMGIGVFESREYVRELGGRIEVTSREGEGSLFRVRLPLLNQEKT